MKKFELICLFDVLEHIHNDEQILHDLYVLLSQNGTLLLTVPAHPALWSYFDEASHHKRRYTVADLQLKLVAAGFKIKYLSQYMAILFPIMWMGRKLATLSDHRLATCPEHVRELTSRELRIIPIFNYILTWFLTREVRFISRRCNLPIGTSLVAIANKFENPLKTTETIFS